MESTATTTINIIVADDHDLLRHGIISFIKEYDHIRVVAEASDGKQLVQLTRQFLPDVVLTDIHMPVMTGIEATRIISREFPGIGIIALTMIDSPFMITGMIAAGAKGYVFKNSIKKEMIDGINAVNKNDQFYCSGARMKMAGALISNNLLTDHVKEMAFTKRQKEIIKLICDGLSTQQMADKLHLGYRTVENYRARILQITGCNNTASLVFFITQNNLHDL